jgi:hypothetical protein
MGPWRSICVEQAFRFVTAASRMGNLRTPRGSIEKAGPASGWLSVMTVTMKRYGNLYDALE